MPKTKDKDEGACMLTAKLRVCMEVANVYQCILQKSRVIRCHLAPEYPMSHSSGYCIMRLVLVHDATRLPTMPDSSMKRSLG